MREAIKFLTLFAAEEIPATIVTFVALLMLLQLGLTPAVATFCSALLFVPWVLKSFMRPWVSKVGYFRLMLHLIEALLFASLVLLAFSFNTDSSIFNHQSSIKAQPLLVFLALFLVSLLSAWHEMVARMFYETALRPSLQRLLTVPRLVCSQVAVVFTYGALIFLVGTLEVYFRQIRYSWSMGCYVAAGLFLLLFLLHLLTLSNSPIRGRIHSSSYAIQNPSPQGWGRWGLLLLLFLLLLPQAFMFHARVLYLYDTQAHGGLQCTMQEIGFAQGTVGVIAFSLGLFLSRRLITSTFRLFNFSTFALVLSPFVYLGMTIRPPQSLLELCVCTLTAQLLFGLGLGACRLPISAISGNRYRSTINMLQIPIVAAALFVPMAVSGWMVEQLGYETYFLVNALTAPVCLLGVWLLRKSL